MVVIYGGNVVIDNAWYWRADTNSAGVAVTEGANAVQAGLHVFGKNVTAYGLSVENTLGNQVEWRGEGGNVYFFQSTLPLDAGATWAAGDYVAYKVDPAVTTHNLWGAGAYSAFRDNHVLAFNAFDAPDAPGVSFGNIFTLYLGGISGQADTIANVINGQGGPVGKDAKKGLLTTAYVCSYNNGHSTTSTTPVEEFFLQ